jgi:hypothetical protein
MVHQRWTPLGAVGGCAGRHGVLSPGNMCAVSVVGWFGCGTSGFREGASETVLRGGVLVQRRAGRGWHRACVSVPCRCAWREGLDEVRVHWNAMHALRALGGSDASKRHGRGGVHGRSWAGLAWGIDPWARCEAGGEVMAR